MFSCLRLVGPRIRRSDWQNLSSSLRPFSRFAGSPLSGQLADPAATEQRDNRSNRENQTMG